MTCGLDAVWSALSDHGVWMTSADDDAARSSARLDELGVKGLDRLAVVTDLEQQYRVSFTADLLSAIGTVEELAYYLEVKMEQSESSTAGRHDE